MSLFKRSKEVTFSGLDIVITSDDPSNTSKTPQYYNLCTIKSIESLFTPNPSADTNYYAVLANVIINWTDTQGQNAKFVFDVQDVTNQGTWLPTPAGLAIAVADISAQKALVCTGGGGGPIETVLEEILDELKDDATFTTSAVEDTVTGLKYFMVTTRNMDTGALVYTYIDGDANPFVPVNPMKVLGLNDQTVHVSSGPWVNGDFGIGAWGVRNDLLAPIINNDLNYGPIALKTSGELRVSDGALETLITNNTGALASAIPSTGFVSIALTRDINIPFSAYPDNSGINFLSNKDTGNLLVEGNIGGFSKRKSEVITTTNGVAYSINDNIGGIVEVDSLLRISGGTGILHDIALWSKENQKPNLIIDFWKESPLLGTYSNNAPQVIQGDEDSWIGCIEVAATDWIDTGTIARCRLTNLGGVLSEFAATDMYMTMQTKTAVTYTSVTGMIVKVGILQD